MSVCPISDAWLKPLAPFMAEGAGINEININEPGRAWLVPAVGKKRKVELSELSYAWCRSLADLVSQQTNQRLSEETPLMSAHLLGGERIQFVSPPATTADAMAVSIRIPSRHTFALQDYRDSGALNDTTLDLNQAPIKPAAKRAADLVAAGRVEDALELSVKERLSIVISGGTYSGKTSLMNALLRLVPTDERLISLEDSHELHLPDHEDVVRLYYSRDSQGKSKAGPVELLQAGLRMNPSRFMLAELRGAEAYAYIRAVRSGHPGSITTVHADTPQLALEQMAMMVMQAGLGLGHSDVLRYLRGVVDLIVQIEFDASTGKRRIPSLFFTQVATL